MFHHSALRHRFSFSSWRDTEQDRGLVSLSALRWKQAKDSSEWRNSIFLSKKFMCFAPSFVAPFVVCVCVCVYVVFPFLSVRRLALEKKKSISTHITCRPIASAFDSLPRLLFLFNKYSAGNSSSSSIISSHRTFLHSKYMRNYI